MSRDLIVLKVMLQRNNFDNYCDMLPNVLCSETTNILNGYDEYYKLFPELLEITLPEFISWFHYVKHINYTKDLHDQYDIIFNNVSNNTIAPQLVDEFIKSIQEEYLFTKLKDSKSIGEVGLLLDQYNKQSKASKNIFCNATLEEALEFTDPEGGYKWRLSELNSTLGTLTSGSFGIVAARPNSGKTSFIVSEMSYMAQQLKNSTSILWLNNENKGIRIIPRLYAAMCNATRQEIITNVEVAKSKFNELGGHKIKIVDIQGWKYKQVENLTKTLKPAIVILDMLDNIKGPKISDGDTADSKYEVLYQWALELACKYDCAVIATSQMNFEGEGVRYPDMTVLKGSRGSAKQGAASWILMIGRDEENYKSRYLSAPKSKFGNDMYKSEVVFDSERSLFLSPQSKFRVFGG